MMGNCLKDHSISSSSSVTTNTNTNTNTTNTTIFKQKTTTATTSNDSKAFVVPVLKKNNNTTNTKVQQQRMGNSESQSHSEDNKKNNNTRTAATTNKDNNDTTTSKSNAIASSTNKKELQLMMNDNDNENFEHIITFRNEHVNNDDNDTSKMEQSNYHQQRIKKDPAASDRNENDNDNDNETNQYYKDLITNSNSNSILGSSTSHTESSTITNTNSNTNTTNNSNSSSYRTTAIAMNNSCHQRSDPPSTNTTCIESRYLDNNHTNDDGNNINNDTNDGFSSSASYIIQQEKYSQEIERTLSQQQSADESFTTPSSTPSKLPVGQQQQVQQTSTTDSLVPTMQASINNNERNANIEITKLLSIIQEMEQERITFEKLLRNEYEEAIEQEIIEKNQLQKENSVLRQQLLNTNANAVTGTASGTVVPIEEVDDVLAQLDLIEKEHKEVIVQKEQQLVDKDNIIVLLNTQIHSIKNNTTQIELQLSEQILQNDLLINTISNYEETIQFNKLDYDALQEDYTIYKTKIEQTIQSACTTARTEMIVQAEEQFATASELYQRLKNEFDTSKITISNLQQELKVVQTKYTTSIDTISSIDNKLQLQKIQYDKQITTLNNTISEQTVLYDTTIQKLQEQKLINDTSTIKNNTTIHELNNTINSLQSTIACILSSKDKLQVEYNDMKSVCEELMILVEQQDQQQNQPHNQSQQDETRLQL